MTSLHLLGADRRHAELCVLGYKFVVRPSQVCAYLKHLAGFLAFSYILRSRIPPTVAITKMDPLIQSP